VTCSARIACGAQKWELRDPKDANGYQLTTTVFALDTESDLGGAAGFTGQPVAADPADDLRLLQLTSDKQLNVIDARTGHVVKTRGNVALDRDLHWAYGGKLYTANDSQGYRVQMYDLDKLGEPKVVYTSPNDRTLRSLAPCGAGIVCVLDASSYDDKTVEIAAISVDGAKQLWRKAAVGADQLVPMGPRVLATSVDSTPVSHLFGPKGTQLLPDDVENDAGVRVNGTSLILFSKAPSDYPDDVNLSGVSTAPRTPTSLGLLQKVRTRSCSWNEAYIVCASADDFGVWRFAK
jgi:molecular chaperone HscA